MFASVYGVDKLDNTQKYSVKVYTMLALSKVKSRDALFICPFNEVHQVQRGKYMNHIYHCHRNPAHSNYVQCDFHDGHWLPNKEFAEYHMMYECPDAKEQTRKLKEEREIFKSQGKAPVKFNPDDYGEGW